MDSSQIEKIYIDLWKNIKKGGENNVCWISVSIFPKQEKNKENC